MQENKTYVKVVAGDRDTVMFDSYGYFTKVSSSGDIKIHLSSSTFVTEVIEIGNSLMLVSQEEYESKGHASPKQEQPLSDSIMLNTDSYKPSMFVQYPTNTEYVYSYIESRGGKYDRTVFTGIQGFVKKYLIKPITQAEIDFAAKIWEAHGEPFDRAMWEHILHEHKGYLPVKVMAAKEGSVIPTKNVLATVVNTDPRCFGLTTFLETALLRAIWYPTTVATASWHIKQLLLNYLEKSGDPTTIGFKLHDFGARGVSSFESACIGGAAHLVNFMGTDTISSIPYIMDIYGGDVCGFSIPAAEHSTITSWSREGEVDAYRNMLKQFAKPGSTVAVVSDSYDIYNACEKLWGGELRQEVIDSGATVVIRPDSGEPVEVLTKMMAILESKFGATKNTKGYKVLNSVRIIWGDGINPVSLESILRTMVDLHGYSADNFAFGMGGGLLQQLDRDTLKFAMKCSAVGIREIVGDEKMLGIGTQYKTVWRDVFKDPITDKGKASKKGRVTLFKSNKDYVTDVVTEMPKHWTDKPNDWKECLEVYYENGSMPFSQTFDQVRENSNV